MLLGTWKEKNSWFHTENYLSEMYCSGLRLCNPEYLTQEAVEDLTLVRTAFPIRDHHTHTEQQNLAPLEMEHLKRNDIIYCLE